MMTDNDRRVRNRIVELIQTYLGSDNEYFKSAVKDNVHSMIRVLEDTLDIDNIRRIFQAIEDNEAQLEACNQILVSLDDSVPVKYLQRFSQEEKDKETERTVQRQRSMKLADDCAKSLLNKRKELIDLISDVDKQFTPVASFVEIDSHIIEIISHKD